MDPAIKSVSILTVKQEFEPSFSYSSQLGLPTVGIKDANRNRVLRRTILAALILYAISCLLHGAALLGLGKDPQACCIAGDSAEYLKLSNTSFSDLNRTPGYPVFLRVVRKIFGPSLEPVLWIQVFLISLVPALVALFAGLAFSRFPNASYISGLLSSVSFTGIKLGHMILTEALFVPLVMAALAALIFSLITGTSYWQGSRLMYPAEPVLMLLSGFALAKKEALSPGEPHLV